jgi:hypothetical protein
MRRIYTVHEKRAAPGGRVSEPVLIREGFAFWAFVFGPFWALWHRLWLVALLLIVLNLAVASLPALAGIGEAEAGAAQLGLILLTGLFARDLRRWTLARRGWALTAVVCADDSRVAEWRYFDARAAGRAAAAAPSRGPGWMPAGRAP